MRSADANDLASWSKTASQLEGFNVNRAPHDTDPASNNEYRTIFAQFTNAESAITEFARSQATRDPDMTDELAFPSIAQRLTEIFRLESNSGYELTAIMLSGAAGLKLGMALIAPGRYTRRLALRRAMAQAIKLMYGAAALFIAAAFVEAYWSSIAWIPPLYKYLVGLAGWLVVALYFIALGRKHAA